MVVEHYRCHYHCHQQLQLDLEQHLDHLGHHCYLERHLELELIRHEQVVEYVVETVGMEHQGLEVVGVVDQRQFFEEDQSVEDHFADTGLEVVVVVNRVVVVELGFALE